MGNLLHYIHIQNINTTPIQNWCSTRRISITYIIQHINIRHKHSKNAIIPTGNTYIDAKNLILNPDKTTCILFTPDPAEYSTQLALQIDTTREHQPTNIRTHSRRRNHILQQSTQNNTNTQSTDINNMGKTKGEKE